MKFYKPNQVKEIVNAFNQNKIIAILTDTVFGLMAIASQENEARINAIKKSESYKKISIIFGDFTLLNKYINSLSIEEKEIIKKGLPGKVTYVVNLDDSFAKEFHFIRNDFGIRITTKDYLQTILIELNKPVLATSCNISTNKPCSDLDSMIEQFGKELPFDVVIDHALSDSKPTKIFDLRYNKKKVLRE